MTSDRSAEPFTDGTVKLSPTQGDTGRHRPMDRPAFLQRTCQEFAAVSETTACNQAAASEQYIRGHCP